MSNQEQKFVWAEGWEYTSRDGTKFRFSGRSNMPGSHPVVLVDESAKLQRYFTEDGRWARHDVDHDYDIFSARRIEQERSEVPRWAVDVLDHLKQLVENRRWDSGAVIPLVEYVEARPVRMVAEREAYQVAINIIEAAIARHAATAATPQAASGKWPRYAVHKNDIENRPTTIECYTTFAKQEASNVDWIDSRSPRGRWSSSNGESLLADGTWVETDAEGNELVQPDLVTLKTSEQAIAEGRARPLQEVVDELKASEPTQRDVIFSELIFELRSGLASVATRAGAERANKAVAAIEAHVAERDAEIAELRAEVERLKSQQNGDTEMLGVKFIDEARQLAAQCWCDDETKDRVMDPALCEAVAKRINSWMCDAAQYLRNQQFCHGLIVKIGEKFGKPAYTSDDGSVQQDVLALKVPELVDQLRQRADAAEAKVKELEFRLSNVDRTAVDACNTRDASIEHLTAKLAAAEREIERLKGGAK